MHIPDGFLSTGTWVPAWLLSAGGLGYSLKKTAQAMKDRMIPLMGVMSAFIFAAQMVNFPVMGGTSGHLLGGVLAAVLLGPFAGAIVLSCVLIVQCLIFQDGGLTALGANIFNMAIIGAMGGYLFYKVLILLMPSRKGIIVAAAVASWFSVFAAATICALELAISGTSPIAVVVPAMAGVHAIIGLGEAVITGLVVGFVLKVRPDLIYGQAFSHGAGASSSPCGGMLGGAPEEGKS
jgi:cobalt/nickel transport system permease protein